MAYVGIRTRDKGAFAQFLRCAEDQGAGVQTLSRTPPHVGLALDRESFLQVELQENGLCAVDGRIPSAKKRGKARERGRHRSDAGAVLDEWMRRKKGGLRRIDVTASVSLWDAESKQLILARSRNGIPPLFFAKKQDALLWSNSIKALLAYGVDAELDLRALDSYFALGYVPAPWTMIESVRKVPAGQFLECTRDGQVFKRHRAPVRQSRTVQNLDAFASTFKEKLCRSLEEIVDGHNRVGVLLSSGVDSSLLVALLHVELGVPVEAFTFEYADYEGKYNEYEQARRLTGRYGIPHHKIAYSADWLKANLPAAVRQYEEPFSYGNHTARLSEVVEKDVGLLLNGVKGDMHLSRTGQYALRWEGSSIKKAARGGRKICEMWPFGEMRRTKHFADLILSSPEEIFYEDIYYHSVLPDAVRRQLYRNTDVHKTGRKAMFQLFRTAAQNSGLNRKSDQLSYMNNAFFVPDHLMWWNYRWTHAYGLDMGAPYLAPEVRPWIESLRQPLWPPHKESIRKVLIRRAAATVMPEEIAYGRKIDQSVPFWWWFQGSLRSLLHKYLRPSKLHEEGLFEVDFVQQEMKKHISGKGTRPYLLWTLLCFMVWKEEFLEG